MTVPIATLVWVLMFHPPLQRTPNLIVEPDTPQAVYATEAACREAMPAYGYTCEKTGFEPNKKR